MIILEDTREQKPLEFNHPWVTEVKRIKLDVGDYGCQFKDGHVVPIYFERKSIADLYGTLGKGYRRFKRAIIRAHENQCTLFIIVEGNLSKVARGYNRSQIKGASMLYKLFTIFVRYGVQTIFVKDRKEMRDYITNFYIACGKEHVRRLEEG